MDTVAEHEFIENQQGQLILLLNTLADTIPDEAMFLVSETENVGYLRRDGDADDIHQIIGINPTIIDRLRGIKEILVVEMTDEEMVHTYPAVTGLYVEADA